MNTDRVNQEVNVFDLKMAQQGNQLDREKFCCSICLDLLKDPVTIPCGHSYCMGCIKSQWYEEDLKGTHSCPQCRQIFRPRPVLVKNVMLAELVEELKATRPQAAPADHCDAGPEDVTCDFCTEKKRKAVKSCLQCLVSYCEQHLQPHYDVAALKKHKLVDPSKGLQENICPRHNEVMKIFCRTDQQCICILCSMDEHKGHDTVSAAAEMAERQRKLGGSRQVIQKRIQTRGEDVRALLQQVEAINDHADKAVKDCEAIVADAKQQIRSRQKAEVSRVEELQEKLEQEIAELKGKDAELEELSRAEDHTQFLHKCPPLSQLSESAGSRGIGVRPQRYFEDVSGAVSGARGKLQDALTEEWSKVSLTETGEDVLLPPDEPKSRDEFLKYRQHITMNPCTASQDVQIKGNGKQGRFVPLNSSKYQHPDRFTCWCQVLCWQPLTGRCYWEVQWTGEVFIAVGYENISRTGNESGFGNNGVSWALQCSDDPQNSRYVFKHNNVKTSISGPQSSRVGVYLDHRAGTLAFYGVSGTMTLLHRVQTTFTEPLFAGFGIYVWQSYAELCDAESTVTGM